MTMVPLSMGSTTRYAADLSTWSAKFKADQQAETRLENMLGRLILTVLRKRGDDQGLACRDDPNKTENGLNVLHFQLKKEAPGNNRWLCLRLVSDPAKMGTPLTFEVWSSDGQEPSAKMETLDSNMGLRRMWEIVDPL